MATHFRPKLSSMVPPRLSVEGSVPYIGGASPSQTPPYIGGASPPQTPPWGDCVPPDLPAIYEGASPPQTPPEFWYWGNQLPDGEMANAHP